MPVIPGLPQLLHDHCAIHMAIERTLPTRARRQRELGVASPDPRLAQLPRIEIEHLILRVPGHDLQKGLRRIAGRGGTNEEIDLTTRRLRRGPGDGEAKLATECRRVRGPPDLAAFANQKRPLLRETLRKGVERVDPSQDLGQGAREYSA